MNIQIMPDFTWLTIVGLFYYGIIAFSIPLFGIGLEHFLMIIQNRTTNYRKSERTVTLAWGMIILGLLLGQLLRGV